MKLIILSLLIASVGVAEAKVYKCPEEVEGRFTYQSKPCPNTEEDEPEKNELKIIPVNEEKVKAAREKLEKDLVEHKDKKDAEAGIVKPAAPVVVTLPPPKK
ncbi:MAG: hypothetical protein GQ569_05735 [Methylococcaceae bacterium]|nr:hypothetical protein [Methylococcaceae bacterium]